MVWEVMRAAESAKQGFCRELPCAKTVVDRKSSIPDEPANACSRGGAIARNLPGTDPSDLAGLINIREVVSLDSSGNSMTGTVSFDFYTPDGVFGGHVLDGTVTGTRVTPQPDTPIRVALGRSGSSAVRKAAADCPGHRSDAGALPREPSVPAQASPGAVFMRRIGFRNAAMRPSRPTHRRTRGNRD
jgi:hypothetical protein